MFIVVLLMTLMLGMGMFAARAGAMTELDAGYDRESAQTDAVLQHGVVLAAAQISVAPGAAANFAKNPTGAAYTNGCLSGAWFQAIPNYTYYCLPYNAPALSAGMISRQSAMGVSNPIGPFTDPSAGGMGAMPDLTNPNNNVPGSLGYGAVTAQMSVELTDLGEVGRPPAGTATGSGAVNNSLKYYGGTLGAWGQVGPYIAPALLGAGAGACTPGSQLYSDAITTAREVGRAFITLGPI